MPHYYQNEFHILDQIKGTHETARDENYLIPLKNNIAPNLVKEETVTSGQPQAKRSKTTQKLTKYTFRSGKETPLEM